MATATPPEQRGRKRPDKDKNRNADHAGGRVIEQIGKKPNAPDPNALEAFDEAAAAKDPEAALGASAETAPEDGGRSTQLGQIRASLLAMRADGGAALPGAMQSELGSRLGADLSGVRVYDNAAAHEATAAMGALAFTQNQDIALSAGFNMSSPGGEHVMAHELVHVVQNQRSSGNSMELASYADIGPSSSPIESEAEEGATAIRSGQSFSVSSRGALPAISRYSGPTPTPGPTPVATPGPTPTATPSPTTGGGDGDIAAIMNSMADPAARGQHQTFTGTIDGLRLQAMQFTYNSTSFFRSFTQAFWPSDAVKEHAGQLMGNTVYNHASGEGLNRTLEQAQGVIERIRGFIRIVGDLAAAVGTWMGLLGLIGDGLVALAAVFPPAEVVAVPIKKIVDVVGSIPWLVKAATDILDAVIGIVQIIILLIRAHNTTNPAERARIAQQMRKEAGDLVSACMSVAMSVATAAVSAAVSASANTLMGAGQQTLKQIAKSAKAGKVSVGLRNTGRKWWKAFKSDFRAGTLGKPRESTANIIKAFRSQRLAVRAGINRVRRSGSIFSFPTTGKKTKFNDWRGSVQAGVGGFAVSAVSGHTAAVAKAPTTQRTPSDPKANPPSQAPGPENDRMAMTNLKLWIWPAQLDQMQQIQGTVAPAKTKVMEAYQSARSDCDPALLAQFDTQFGKITQQNGRLRSEAMHQRLKAAQQQQETQRGTQQHGQADAKAGQATGQTNQIQTKGQQARTEATQLRPVPQPADDGGANILKRGLDWAYDNTIGRLLGPVNAKIQQLQSWMTDGLSRLLLSQFSKEELDMAGIGDDLRAENQKEAKNQQQAQETDSESKKIDAELKKLQEGRRDTEIRATNSMMDALQLLEQLDEADADITEMIADGTTYIAEVQKEIEHRRAIEGAGQAIDAAYIAPVVTGVTDAKTDMTGRTDEVQTMAQQALTELATSLGDAASTATWAGASSAANAKIAEIVGKHRTVSTQGLAGLESYLNQVNAQVGTQNYSTVQEIATLAQDFGDKVYHDLNALEADIGKLMDHVYGEMEQAFNQCIATPDPQQTAPTSTPTVTPTVTPTPNPTPGPTPDPTGTPDPTVTPTPDPTGTPTP